MAVRGHAVSGACLGGLGIEPGGTVNPNRITPLNEESFNLLAVFWASHRLLLSCDTVQQQWRSTPACGLTCG